MDTITLLKLYSDDLAAAIERLSDETRTAKEQQDSCQKPPPYACDGAQAAKAAVLSANAKINALVCGPTQFLQHLANQTEILACLRWLGEFQILACIPLVGSVLIEDVANLTNVPETHLSRIIRLTSTAGFLEEPEPGHVSHTPLSASFFFSPSLLDAAMFLSECVAPAALQMTKVTHEFGDSGRFNETAYTLALPVAKPFHTMRSGAPKLNRQWCAYLQYAGGLPNCDDVNSILKQLSWHNIGSMPDTHIVEVNAPSVSTSVTRCLVELHPTLQLTLQLADLGPQSSQDIGSKDLDSQVTISRRTPGARQTATDAAVYILHLPLTSPSSVLSELLVHLEVLRERRGIMLIWTARMLPEPGTLTDPELEATARSRDLALLHTTPLFVASTKGHLEVVKVLLENGASTATANITGVAPLHVAARLGHLEMIKLLLVEGAAIEAVDDNGRSPQVEASRRGHVEVAELLYKKRADIEAASKKKGGRELVPYREYQFVTTRVVGISSAAAGW
ncbi:O-methyltransferase family protein [Pochonia chlamydosporia 170]|uniref:O-methyltransferase family protein n=1 Tax=Pochonia chlamydosporia 170 TaxID=1380566 RepID=A0A179F5N7_METCM|nr:O-methyltransferase family protein [Pochonia chlamydosporia 170]OAQ60738.1 O-methyltransferase family protein [Pochonia chlamydosporia 170]